MCIAILNTKGALSKKQLTNSWENNNQGGGLLYNEGGELKTFKTYSKKEFIKTYYKVRERVKGKIVLHFRIATSGHEKYINLHPFLVNNTLGFVHNGIIGGLGNQQHSDTYQFNEMLKTLKHDFLKCNGTLKFISKYIGSSKLIFLDSSDNHTIVNENLGHWENDNWYSNDSYKQVESFSYFGNAKIWKNNKDLLNFDYYPIETPRKKRGKNEEAELAEYLTYYTNVTEQNIKNLESLIGVDRYDPEFINHIEEVSFYIGTSNLTKILDQTHLEIDGYYTQSFD